MYLFVYLLLYLLTYLRFCRIDKLATWNRTRNVLYLNVLGTQSTSYRKYLHYVMNGNSSRGPLSLSYCWRQMQQGDSDNLRLFISTAIILLCTVRCDSVECGPLSMYVYYRVM